MFDLVNGMPWRNFSEINDTVDDGPVFIAPWLVDVSAAIP